MPVPTVPTYAAVSLVAAHTSFRDLIDSGAGAGYIAMRNSADLLLAQVPLVDPCGTINGTTGRLALAIAGPDTSANASGTVAYAEFCNSTGTVYLSLPAQVGASAVSGYIVLNTLTVVAGSPVEVLSATVG